MVDELLGAVEQAGDVAEPQAGELQRAVQRAVVRAALGAAARLVALALGALALLGGQQVEVGVDAAPDLAAAASPWAFAWARMGSHGRSASVPRSAPRA